MKKALLDKRVAQVLKALPAGTVFIGMLGEEALFWGNPVFRAVRISASNPRSNFLTLEDKKYVSLDMMIAKARWHGTVND